MGKPDKNSKLMGFIIKEALTAKEIKDFVKFPHKLYRDCKQYVPVIDSDEFNMLTKSPSLDYCKIRMWMAIDDKGKIAGRIAAILNPRSNEYHNEKRVRFGWFDFIDNREVAAALLSKAEEWGKEEGMEEIHGPLGYNTLNRQGMLTEGFENTPPINCLYNYPYYNTIMNQLGYGKQMDWVQIKLRANEGVPEKIKRINLMLLEKYNLRVLDIKELKGSDKYVDRFFKSYNEGFSEIANFVPLTRKEVEKLAKEYFPRLKEELTCVIVDKNDNIAAFGICVPNLSEAFQRAGGRLFPFGVFHILRGFRRYNTIDLMLLGASSEWQNKGISSIYHTHIASNLERGEIRYAITNPQAENNSSYKVWERYGYEPYMRRRCYIKSL
jgi:GNAT superfamily N-acetyltransferase